MTVEVVLATANAHKVAEMQRLVGAAAPGIRLIGYHGPSPVEDGITFEHNALVKARASASRTGLPALADDSGLAVDALGGAPGVFSALWSGRHGDDAANRALLAAQLADVPDEHRGASFVCVLALVAADGAAIATAEGRWRGTLARAERGAHGFGYDPLFVPEGGTATAAELDPEEKDALSHRARAVQALAPALATLATPG